MVSKHLRKVYLNADVYALCLQHALTTEKQEVMGLLLGDVDEVNLISNIHAFKILHCSVKESDRVEISPEELCEGAVYAETLARKLERPMRVLGWYHSHPHITVWPSHVDVRTQAAYQMMDPLFIGVIFSVYPSDSGAVENQVQVTCFQTEHVNQEMRRREIELVIKSSPMAEYNLEALAHLPKILVQEALARDEYTEDKEDILSILNSQALRTIELGNIISKMDVPMFEAMEGRLEANKQRIQDLERIKEQLLREME